MALSREFVEVPAFVKRWSDLGLTDDDLLELEIYLCGHPEAGDIIQGTGGLRKIRWRLGGKGKRGGIRVLYVDFVMMEKIYLITAYGKSEKDDLSPAERSEIRRLIDILKAEGRIGHDRA